jgi:hypothetical protein
VEKGQCEVRTDVQLLSPIAVAEFDLGAGVVVLKVVEGRFAEEVLI